MEQRAFQAGEEMVREPGFELGTPIFSAGCLKRRRGHKSLRHNVGSSSEVSVQLNSPENFRFFFGQESIF